MTFTDIQKAELAKPLGRDAVKERKQAGRKLSYVEGWHVIAEANRIFGFDGWDRETISLTETNRDLVNLTGDNGPYQQWRLGYIAKVRVRVGAVIREGTGYGSGMGKPEAIGDAVEGAIKEAETDAMKRALMTFGNPFGLALYDKSQANVSDNEPVRAAPSKYSSHRAAIIAAGDLTALKNGFDAAKADKSLTAEEADMLIAAKDQRKRELTVSAASLGQHLDNLHAQEQGAPNPN